MFEVVAADWLRRFDERRALNYQHDCSPSLPPLAAARRRRHSPTMSDERADFCGHGGAANRAKYTTKS